MRVILDPALSASAARRAPERDERAHLVTEARSVVGELRVLLARPGARAYFREHYGLNPLRILDRDDFAVIVRPFPHHSGPAGVQVGGYVFGETTLDLNVGVLLALGRAADPGPWRRYAAGVLVHELAHLADFLDDGVNDDGGLLEGEEGEAAQKASGCELEPPGPVPQDAAEPGVTASYWSPRKR